MNQDDVLSGRAGIAGLQWALNGQSSRRLLRQEVQKMLKPGYSAGQFHLTRAKYKPDRKLLAYFTVPALDEAGREIHSMHLAVGWQKTLDETRDTAAWELLQEEANQSGLMPVQCDLWRERPERGLRLQLWPFDPKFPRLVQLGNPSNVAGMFASLGIPQDPKRMPVVSPIRYRPGERHVLRYEIGSSGTGETERLYGKLYSNGEDAARAFGIANRVVDWLASQDDVLEGNRPQAISQEAGVILYPHAPGIPLSQQLDRSRRWLGAQLHIIGRSLAILHSGPETLQADLKQNSFADEAKVVKRASEHIQVLLPEAHGKILQILDEAQENYFRLPREKPTFTHADFKSDHLLSTPQGLTLIDFDTCTLTDPALDIGKFLADLEWWFTLQGISGVEDAQAELLKGYLAAASNPGVPERLRRARLFHVLILVKIVARRVPLYKKEWGTLTETLIGRAAQLLHTFVK